MGERQSRGTGRELPRSLQPILVEKHLDNHPLMMHWLYSTLTLAMNIMKLLTSQTYQGQANHVNALYVL